MAKFASTLTNAEYAECKRLEAAGLTSLSQAVKAFERDETAKIEAWRVALKAKTAPKP